MSVSDHTQESGPDLVELARTIAKKAHEGQFRRDGVTPYIEHPAAVASRAPKSPESQAAAWLHDVLEDTNLSAANLRAQGIPARTSFITAG